MSTDILRGTGTLRAPNSKELVATVTYHIWDKPETECTHGKWWGGFTLDRLIAPGEYVIELEDGCKVACFLRVNMQAGRGLVSTYHYTFQGSATLK